MPLQRPRPPAPAPANDGPGALPPVGSEAMLALVVEARRADDEERRSHLASLRPGPLRPVHPHRLRDLAVAYQATDGSSASFAFQLAGQRYRRERMRQR